MKIKKIETNKLWETPLKRSLWRTFSDPVSIDLAQKYFICVDDQGHKKRQLRRFCLDTGKEHPKTLVFDDVIRDFCFSPNDDELIIIGATQDLYRIDNKDFTFVKSYSKAIPKYSNVSVMNTQNLLCGANYNTLWQFDFASESLIKKKMADICFLQKNSETELLCFSLWGEIKKFDLGKKKFSSVFEMPTPFVSVFPCENGRLVFHAGKKFNYSGVEDIRTEDFVWIVDSFTDKNPRKVTVKEGIHLVFISQDGKIGYFSCQEDIFIYDLETGNHNGVIKLPEGSRILHIFTEKRKILSDNHYDTKSKPVLTLYKFD